MAEKTIGILGGMGPEATLDLYGKIIALTRAERDQDHLRVVIDSNPKVPDRNRAIAGTGESCGPALAAMARTLERAGADFLAMACNTAHAFAAEIRAATRLPFVDMIAETGDAVARAVPSGRRIGLLAAQGCLEAGLYQRALADRGFAVLTLEPEDQRAFMRLIYRIKAGDTGAELRQAMLALARSLFARGAELLVAGCTEVPLVVATANLPGPMIDATAVLAERCIAYARGEAVLPPTLVEAS
jgi:aspartate racemase